MGRELSILNLADDYAKVLTLPEAKKWALKRPEPLEVWAIMSPASTEAEEFQARLVWREYPDEPPSLKFRDPATGRLDLPSAWPKVRGFRPTSLDACVNYSSEGFALHPEWKMDPWFRWASTGNIVLKLLRVLQDEIDNHYQGRHP